MLHQLKPIATRSDTVTIHVPNGAPGGMDPIEVTHRQMWAVKEDWLAGNHSHRNECLMVAYAKATRKTSALADGFTSDVLNSSIFR